MSLKAVCPIVQACVATSSESLLEMQTPRPHLGPTESESAQEIPVHMKVGDAFYNQSQDPVILN